MDPVGPWSYTYNRLAAGAAAGATSGDFHHHLATAANNAASVGAPATTSQLLAQAAHTNSLGTSATSAYAGGFLSPPAVGYDAVFPPFLHHPNPKPAHYSSTINAQHRQALAQAAVVAKPVESEYTTPAAAHHQPQSSAFFESGSAGGGSGGSGTSSGSGGAWQGGSNQLPSPFGILPHENVPSSPGGGGGSGGSGKSGGGAGNPTTAASVYDNFNAHIAAQSLYHINTQLAAAAANKAAAAAAARSASPQVSKSTSSASNFYQGIPAGYGVAAAAAAAAAAAESLTAYNPSTVISQKQQQQSTSNSQDLGGSKSSSNSSSHLSNHQQSCVIVSASPVSPSKDYRILATIPTISTIVNSSSSPTTSLTSSPTTSSNSSSSDPSAVSVVNKIKSRQYMVSQMAKVQQQQQQMTKAQAKVYPETNGGDRLVEHPPQSSPISYTVVTNVGKSSPVAVNNRHNTNSPAIYQQQQVTPPYRHEVSFSRKTASSSGSSGTGGGTTTSTPASSIDSDRRPSPHQNSQHSQPSPQMSHVPSPAQYPMYNSPMNSMSSPQQATEHQQHFQQQPRSPLDVSISRSAAAANQVGYSSVITRVQQQPSPQQQNCWDGGERGGQKRYNNQYVQQERQPQQQQQQALQRSYEGTTSSATGITILQDLSNTRGDPMSIVRALQQQVPEVPQQPPQQQVEIKTTAPKRRGRKAAAAATTPVVSDKSSDSSKEQQDYYQNRIPPPAHSSTLSTSSQQLSPQQPPQQQQQQQQQQNGGSYFDFERWNLPPPPPKVFGSGGGGAFTSPQTSSAAGSFVGQSAQSMLVSPHGPPPPHPLPYFPAFHLAQAPSGGHHPGDFTTLQGPPHPTPPLPPSADAYVDYHQHIHPNGSSNSNDNVSSNVNDVRDDDPPKVVVPNIEEELGFLAERGGSSAASNQHPQIVSNTLIAAAPQAQQQQQQSMTPSQQEEQNIAKSIAEKKFNLPKGVGSGFMGSYLKFLQGERDTSPPPASRGGRKATWSRTANNNTTTSTSSTSQSTTSTTASKAGGYNQQQQQQISNGVNIHPQQILQPQTSDIDDGRYYQQQQQQPSRNNSKRKYDDDDERNRKKIDTKEDKNKKGRGGIQQPQIQHQPAHHQPQQQQQQQPPPQQPPSNSLQTLQQPTPSVVQATAPPPHLPLHPHPHHHHPQPPPQMMQQSYYQQPDEVPQRREMSHRKAKGRSVLQLLNMSLEDDFAGAASEEEPPEFQDSDTDPVWIPGAPEDEDEEYGKGRKKKPKSKGKRNSQGSGHGSFSQYFEDDIHEEVVVETTPMAEMGYTAVQESVQQSVNRITKQDNGPEASLKVGQFIVDMQDEIMHEWPKLWRIDGKNLLEKYEPILKAGKIVYRNVSVFAGLLPDSHMKFRAVKVQPIPNLEAGIKAPKHAMVEWLRDQAVSPVKSTDHHGVIRETANNPPPPPLPDLGGEILSTTVDQSEDQQPLARLMLEKKAYQEHFEIFLQTLISQALDPNFFTEIIQENDEYFLISVRAIDSLVEGLRSRLQTVRPLPRTIHTAVTQWPSFTIQSLIGFPPHLACTACLEAVATSHVIFAGQTYHAVTLTAKVPDTDSESSFQLCNSCGETVKLHHRLIHQKYTLFMECTQKVHERSSRNSTKTSTEILNELLAEESWLQQLFRNVRQLWAEIEIIVDDPGLSRRGDLQTNSGMRY
ncbi:hypothetical protein DMENIID0001_148210 [Sergentomyia squamirostris]